MDKEFNSSDLVGVLAAGTYEADVDAGWSTGDFDASGQFDSSDMIATLADGGEFGSADLTMVLQAGEYEDAATLNSTWATGDWDGDGDFKSTDLITALAHGSYEQGPRAAVRVVPEPASFVVLMVGLIGISIRRRQIGP